MVLRAAKKTKNISKTSATTTFMHVHMKKIRFWLVFKGIEPVCRQNLDLEPLKVGGDYLVD